MQRKESGNLCGTDLSLQAFLEDERGMGTVEIILIIVVLIGLVIIFKNQLTALVGKVFNKINTDSDTIISAIDGGRTPMV